MTKINVKINCSSDKERDGEFATANDTSLTTGQVKWDDVPSGSFVGVTFSDGNSDFSYEKKHLIFISQTDN